MIFRFKINRFAAILITMIAIIAIAALILQASINIGQIAKHVWAISPLAATELLVFLYVLDDTVRYRLTPYFQSFKHGATVAPLSNRIVIRISTYACMFGTWLLLIRLVMMATKSYDFTLLLGFAGITTLFLTSSLISFAMLDMLPDIPESQTDETEDKLATSPEAPMIQAHLTWAPYEFPENARALLKPKSIKDVPLRYFMIDSNIFVFSLTLLMIALYPTSIPMHIYLAIFTVLAIFASHRNVADTTK